MNGLTHKLTQMKIHRFKDGSQVQVTPDWQYVHLQELQNLLALKRVNLRGKDTTKFKAFDAKKKFRCCNFIHTKHLEPLCMRCTRPVKANWIWKIFVAHCNAKKASREKTKAVKKELRDDEHTDIIREILENFWTQLPLPVITSLEHMVGLRGMVNKLRDADLALRRQDEATELDRAAIERAVALATAERVGPRTLHREENPEETKCEDDV